MSRNPLIRKQASPSLFERSGYAVAELSQNTYWQLFMMLQLYFYTDVFGITAAQAGTMFLVTRLWDAINDPIVGILADRTRTRWGRYRPWLLWAALPFAVLGVASFSTPPFSDTNKLIYAYVTYSLLGVAYTAVGIPLASMIGASSSDSIVRTSLSSWKMMGAFVAALVAQLFTLRLVELLGGVEIDPGQTSGGLSPDNLEAMRQGFQRTTMIYSAVAVIALVYAFTTMRERLEAARGPSVRVIKQLTQLAASRAWWVLFGVFIMMCLFISIRGATAVYYVKYYLQVSGEVNLLGWTVTEGTAIGIYLALGSVGCLIGTPFMAPLAARFGKRNMFVGMMLISAVLAVLHYPLGRNAVFMAFLLQTLVGLFAGPLFVLKNAMLADIADAFEVEHGYRPTGLIFSAASFSFKLGWTVGGAAAGFALAWYAFDPNLPQTPRTIEGMRVMMSFLPLVPILIASILLFAYPLTEKRVAENTQSLAGRRQNEDSTAETRPESSQA